MTLTPELSNTSVDESAEAVASDVANFDRRAQVRLAIREWHTQDGGLCTADELAVLAG